MLMFISESCGTDRPIYSALLKGTHYISQSALSLKRRIWSATEITKGTCCVQQLVDTHNFLDVTHQ